MEVKKYIFIHTAKTGGGSISEVMKRHQIPIDPTNQAPSKQLWTNKEYDLPQFKNFNLHSFDFSFGFVRNPYERLVSAFIWDSHPSNPIEQKSLTQRDFSNFVKNFVLCENKFSFFRWSHVMPYFDTRAKLFNDQGDQRVSLIGRFENLQEDFNIACRKMNIQSQELSHKHKSHHEHYTEYYDDETKQIVAEKYAKDIEHFGYEFGD
jgi:hypothetical protein